jgi:hypothetical protein
MACRVDFQDEPQEFGGNVNVLGQPFFRAPPPIRAEENKRQSRVVSGSDGHVSSEGSLMPLGSSTHRTPEMTSEGQACGRKGGVRQNAMAVAGECTLQPADRAEVHSPHRTTLLLAERDVYGKRDSRRRIKQRPICAVC